MRKLLPYSFNVWQLLPALLGAAVAIQMAMILTIWPHYALYSDNGVHAPYITASLYGSTPVWLGYAVIALIGLVIAISVFQVNPWAPIAVMGFSYLFGSLIWAGNEVGLVTRAEHGCYTYGVTFGACAFITVIFTKMVVRVQDSRQRAEAQTRR